MDIESLRLFVAVVRRGSFAGVARDHDLDPSSVSRTIAALEDRLGVRLFQRTTRRLSLTEAGERYFSRIEALLAELDQARDEARAVTAGPAGTLRLTASVAFGQRCLVPLIPDFRESYPEIRVELLLTDAKLDLVSERIDLAIRLGPQIDGDAIGTKLFDTRYRVCASPRYLDRAPPAAVPADLAAHRCLLFSLPDFRFRWRFRRDGEGETIVPIAGDVVISSVLALRDCALAGLGPVLLADWLIDDDLRAGRLVDLFPDYAVTATEFETAAWLLYPSRTYLPNKVRVTIDFLKRRLGGRVSQSATSRPRGTASAP
jgi:DNA-binding transcriptional LysR family regulator